MFSAIARRSARIFPQVRLVRSQPSAIGRLPRVSRAARKKEETGEDEQWVVGETVEVEFQKYPTRQEKSLLEQPSVMTLVKQHRVEVKENAEPQAGFTEDELEIFDQIAEIKVDDALRNFRESSFDAEFLDTIGPGLSPTYNVAALAEKHEVVRKLVEMNVSVYKWDKKPEILKQMLALKWEAHCKPRIEFLVKEAGLEADDLGRVLSRNPLLLTEEMQHLEARLEFLRDKKVGLGFKRIEVSRILSKEAYWLSTPIEGIENRINFFRNHFALNNQDFKKLVVSRPQIIMVQLRQIILKKFSMIEEMGFDQSEIKRAIMNGPKILTLSRQALVERFQVLHLDLGYDHTLLATHPQALYCRASRLKERHAFLKHLGRAQYDNSLPGYVSPVRLTRGTDEDFVTKVAKSTKEEFERFIKNS